MIVKFDWKRQLFIKIFNVLIIVLLLFTIIFDYHVAFDIFSSITVLVPVLLYFVMLYFQAARYDDKKIVAQFGWPRIRYNDIDSIKHKRGDIIIKSDKREIVINKESVDQESLKKFIEHLDKKTPKPINKALLL